MTLTKNLLVAVTLMNSLLTGAQAAESQFLQVYDQLKNHESRITRLEKKTGAASASSYTVPTRNTGVYTVKSGDTISGISRGLGIGSSALMSANGLSEASVIRPGQQLRVPGGSSSNISVPVKSFTPSRVGTETTSVRVGQGGTLYSLSRDYNVSIDEIKALNPGLDELRLKENQLIRMPKTTRRPITVAQTSKSKTKAAEPEPQKQIAVKVKVDANNLGPSPKDLHKPNTTPAKPQQPQQPEVKGPELGGELPKPNTSRAFVPSTAGVSEVAGNEGFMDYMTTEKDTWETLAVRFGTTVETLRQRNGSVAGDRLKGGTSIQVPANRFGEAKEADLN